MATILITRPEPEASAVAVRLQAAGHSCLVSPLLTINRPAWSPPGAMPGAIILTSPRGASAFIAERFKTLPTYCVGQVTARAAQANGYGNIVWPGSGRSAELIARLAADGTTPCLWLSGEDVSTDMVAELKTHGVKVWRRVVYIAEPVAMFTAEALRALRRGEVDWALLSSPRLATLMRERCAAESIPADRIALACLSEEVAAAARGPVWRDIHVSPKPDLDVLLASCGLLCDKQPEPLEGPDDARDEH